MIKLYEIEEITRITSLLHEPRLANGLDYFLGSITVVHFLHQEDYLFKENQGVSTAKNNLIYLKIYENSTSKNKDCLFRLTFSEFEG